jgi:hypothetical protein
MGDQSSSHKTTTFVLKFRNLPLYRGPTKFDHFTANILQCALKPILTRSGTESDDGTHPLGWHGIERWCSDTAVTRLSPLKWSPLSTHANITIPACGRLTHCAHPSPTAIVPPTVKIARPLLPPLPLSQRRRPSIRLIRYHRHAFPERWRILEPVVARGKLLNS